MHIDFSGESLWLIKLRYVLGKCFLRKGGGQNKLTLTHSLMELSLS
jgi:hypothetical protein